MLFIIFHYSGSFLGSDDVEIHKEKHALDIGGFHNTNQECNVISDFVDSHVHIGTSSMFMNFFS